MCISPKPTNRSRTGYVLLFVLVFLTASLLIFGSVMYWASSNANIIKRNNLFNQSEAAAEAATEMVVSSMQHDFKFGNLNSAAQYATNVPAQTGWPQQFLFTTTNGVANLTTVSITPTNWSVLNAKNLVNLRGLGQTCIVASVTSPLNTGITNLSATVQQSLWFGTVSVFQFAIFYNLDCEINPGKAMTINGRVHSNQNLYATGNDASDLLTFSDYVTAALNVYTNRMPNDPNGTRSGNVNFLITTNNPRSQVDTLNLPIGTDTNSSTTAEAFLNLPPNSIAAPNQAAYYASNQIYCYNAADLIISNASNGTNFSVFYQNQNLVNPLIPVAPDVTNITWSTSHGVTTYSTNFYYSYVTNASFYDYRESDTVQAVQLDVSKLNSWFTNTTTTGGQQYNNYNNVNNATSKGHLINGVYIYNSVPLSTTTLPAVRLVNAQQLPPAGLTVATPQPIYVKGNYNTTTNGVNYAYGLGATTNNTVPAAIMGDAITILSTNWNDNYNSSTNVTSRTPATTTINAACLEGIVPTQADSSGTWHYSGGVENFLRLLENWGSSYPLNYNGSIVVMFNSQYATNYWNGNVYGVPTRNWGFDLNFNNPSKIPTSMVPSAKVNFCSDWRAW
jgi:hypothetical protein